MPDTGPFGSHLMKQFLNYWLPPILWAIFIALFSTDDFSFSKTSSFVDPILRWLLPALSQESREAIHIVIRKLGHWTEYFVFALLLARAFRSSQPVSVRRHWVLWSLIVIVFYAASDEIHQLYVASRSGNYKDSLLDIFGGCCAVAMLRLQRKKSAFWEEG